MTAAVTALMQSASFDDDDVFTATAIAGMWRLVLSTYSCPGTVLVTHQNSPR